MYVKASIMRYKCICKDVSQSFEEGEEGDRQIRCLQHNPDKTEHRCSPENRRSNGESQVVQGTEEQVVGG